MNDFTKGDLENMFTGLGHVLDRSHDEESVIKLRKKIQYMIDNYCEHKGENYQVSYGKELINYCNDCKTMWAIK